jgi:hypothetical protein
MDAMPSLIVAGPLLANAIIWTWRNTVGAETVNLSLAVSQSIASIPFDTNSIDPVHFDG